MIYIYIYIQYIYITCLIDFNNHIIVECTNGHYMGASINGGYPKSWMVYMGESS